MTIIGLDTLAIILLMGALALMLTYVIFWYGWNFEFNKRQLGLLILVLFVSGMFVMAWLRKTGDEILIGLALFGLVLIITLKNTFARRRRKRARFSGR